MSRGASALARDAGPALVTATAALPAGVDALDLLRAVPAGRRMLVERPDAGLAVAGVGEALAVAADGPRRFARCAEALAALPDDAVALGGFAFEDVLPATGPWAGIPAASWFVPRLALVHRDGTARLVATATTAGEAQAALGEARTALATVSAADGPTPRRWRLAARRAPAAWCRAVEATLDDIDAGRLRKLVLARAVGVRTDVAIDPLAAVARLRRAHPGCTVFLVTLGAATFVGATPERLVQVDGDWLATAAVAGTAARGASPEADRALAAALLASPKERAEHACVADDVRARITALATDVSAPAEPAVLVTEAVQHLHTPIAARLRPGTHVFDVAAALHPTPAICGAPRGDALAVLRARERMTRGWYGGAVGWCDARGGELVVAIRTALLDGPRALLHAGAGIVAGSTPARELEETRLKLRPLLGALLEL